MLVPGLLDEPGTFFTTLLSSIFTFFGQVKKQLFSLYNILFGLLLVLGLTYIWGQKFFLTSDGPTHVYNSKILLDYLRGENMDFYSRFYEISLSFFPNWFTHASLLLLQTFLNPVLAEKVLVSIYVVMFPISFLFLVKQFTTRISFISLLIFPFVFHFVFYYGFYNFCFSIAFAFLFIGCWKKNRSKKIWQQLVYLLPLSLLVYLTHIFGWFIIGGVLGGIFLAELMDSLLPYRRTSFAKLLQHWLAPFISGLLPTLFSLLFIQTHSAEAQYYPETIQRLWQAFVRLEMLVLWGDKTEFFFTSLIAATLLFGTATTVVLKIKNKRALGGPDGFIIAAALFTLLYFLQPKPLFLAGFWIGRMSWIGWLLLLVWLSVQNIPRVINYGFALLGIFIFVGLIFIRYPYQQKSAEGVKDYLSVLNKIPAHVTILPLSFSHGGQDDSGLPINVYRHQFQHAFDYAGAFKPLINFANYEATTSWFPVQWKQACNSFELLGDIEGNPQWVNLNGFEKTECGYKIDYVVTWCMNEREAFNLSIQKNYNLVATSPSGRTKLWKKTAF